MRRIDIRNELGNSTRIKILPINKALEIFKNRVSFFLRFGSRIFFFLQNILFFIIRQ